MSEAAAEITTLRAQLADTDRRVAEMRERAAVECLGLADDPDKWVGDAGAIECAEAIRALPLAAFPDPLGKGE